MDLGFDQSFENLKKRKKDMDRYARIMDGVWTTNVSADRKFQKTFNGFYRVRRDENWQKIFYDLFESCKTMESRSFELILRTIFEKTGRIEASFSSKMLASLDPQMPIWDSVVLARLGLKPISSTNKEKRIQDAVEIYQTIEYWYRGFLQADGAQDILKQFDAAFSEYTGFSPVKKIDFLLWGSGSKEPLPTKGIEINGYVEVPPIVTNEEFLDKFIDFIESNHWYFGGATKEVEE